MHEQPIVEVSVEAAAAPPGTGVGVPASPASAGFEALYRDAWPDLVRLATLLVGSTAVAEDLVQDAALRTHRRLATVEHPRAYLRAAVVNACRSHLRRRVLERRHRQAVAEEAAAEVAAPEGGELLDALAALPYKQRAVLVLRHWADLPEDEIAEVLGCRPATVRSHAQRGLERLREVIER